MFKTDHSSSSIKGCFIHSLMTFFWWKFVQLGKERPRRNLNLRIKSEFVDPFAVFDRLYTQHKWKSQMCGTRFFLCILWPIQTCHPKSRILWWSLHYPKSFQTHRHEGQRTTNGPLWTNVEGFCASNKKCVTNPKLRTTKKSFESKMQYLH
jgi:hypothetical protein